MRTILQLVIIVITGSITVAPALGQSKSELAGNCLSQAEARKAYPDQYLRYRSVSGAHCWFAPGRKLIAKERAPVRVAAERPLAAEPKLEIPAPNDEDLAYVKDALCGGPCPRFDLDAGNDHVTYRALCGGPCPDFRARARIDEAFMASGGRTFR